MQAVLPFRVADLFLALPLEHAVRVLPMVALTALPQAPPGVRGVIDIQGSMIAVLDLRRRFGLPEQEPRLDDLLLLAQGPAGRIAMIVDSVDVVRRLADEDCAAASALPGGGIARAGLVRGGEGLLLIRDLALFQSAGDEQALAAALGEPA